jgi:hypothetical protein
LISKLIVLVAAAGMIVVFLAAARDLPRGALARYAISLGTGVSPMGVRKFEMLSRNSAYPTALLVMKVFLPDDIRASPIGPKVGRASRVDDLESAALVSSGAYSERVGEQDGTAGVFMELRVHERRLNRRYRLAWALPRRNE